MHKKNVRQIDVITYQPFSHEWLIAKFGAAYTGENEPPIVSREWGRRFQRIVALVI